jgi:hypothetical protein
MAHFTFDKQKTTKRTTTQRQNARKAALFFIIYFLFMKQTLTSFSVLLLLIWTNLSTQAQALNFDGTNDHITLPAALGTAMRSGQAGIQQTYEFWFKGSNAQSVVRVENSTDWSIRIPYNFSGTLEHTIKLRLADNRGVTTGSNIHDGNWHHIAFTWRAGQLMRSYVDGVQVAVSSTNAKSGTPPNITTVVFGSNQGTSEFLNGSIDELRIWAVERTAAQIQDNMNKELAGNETSLLAYYKFNEGVIGGDNSGITQILDATANARHGTLVNFAKSGNASNWVESPIGMKNTWTGATSSDWNTTSNWSLGIVPRTTDSLVFATTVVNQPTLPANTTIASVALSGDNKIVLGDNDLTVTNLSGGSATSYFVTNGAGSLDLNITASENKTFPVGASTTSYDPVTIQPTNATRFKVKVKSKTSRTDFTFPIANFAKVAPRQWDITPTGTPGSTVLSLKNGGTSFRPTLSRIGHYKTSLGKWEEIAATRLDDTWTATVSDFSPFGVGEESGFFEAVLPVELKEFTGKNTEGGNLLTWTTANEVNNKGFSVERRQPTGDSWESIGFVKGNNKASTYQFVDKNPLSTSYYRLRQIDNDGKETVSKVISIATKGNTKLNIYPNPVSNVLTIETDLIGDYQVINLLGQQVLRGKTASQVDVSALPQGSYILKVGLEQVKFIKQ